MAVTLLLIRLATLVTLAGDPFAENVRTTAPRTPEEERQTFHLPPGFEAQLFAAEPDIGKPINMAFDDRGRLWVTQSREYPFPAPLGALARDAIKVLEDTDGDGRADKITTFADGLNIPIGVLPFRGGAIAWSIPNIWHLEDTDGDGKADKRTVLYGPLGWEKDTHGMSSSFRRGLDGWMYLNHGFNNTSVVRGKDGSEIKLQSGNVYRVRTDGSRVEPHSWGQVNPFGSTFDPLGNFYTADCHSAPIYQVLREAYYPSFGKPHDGLGFGPVLMEHSHGSTAIAGLVYYADDRWPDEFRDNMFIGNVMTSRINRDRLTFEGSTPRAIEQPDFMTTDDPWFRPVDLQLGPDGALYVADFYNRIIGHYEVPLDHPGRDRERGRIWRVVYRGNTRPARLGDPAKELASPSLVRRTLATHALADRGGPAALRVARAALRGPSALAAAHALWVLHRLDALDVKLLAAAARHRAREVRTHAQRVLAETAAWTPEHRRLARAGLGDGDAGVRRAAADALGRHPGADDLPALLAALHAAPAADTHLRHVLRIALRDELAAPGRLEALAGVRLPEQDARVVAGLCLGVPASGAGAYLVDHVQRFAEPDAETLVAYVRHAARYVDAAGVVTLASFVRRRFERDLDLQLALFRSIQDGAAQRGQALAPPVEEWGRAIADAALQAGISALAGWRSQPLDDAVAAGGSPWWLRPQRSADGDREAPFLTSRPGGNGAVGRLRSPAFALPPRLGFFLAGQDGPLGGPADGRVVVRLRADGTDEVLAQFRVPRADVAQTFVWQRPADVPARAYLELTDGHDRNGWVAIGRLDPAVVPLPAVGPREAAERIAVAAAIARDLALRDRAPLLGRLLADPALELDARSSVGRALLAVAPSDRLAALVPLLDDTLLPPSLRSEMAGAAAAAGEDWRATVARVMRTAPTRAQVKMAQALAASPAGADTLLGVLEKGGAPTRLLLDRGVSGRLASLSAPALRARTARLTAGLAPIDEERQHLIEKRRAAFQPARAHASVGAQVFSRTCAPCHRIEGQGGSIGPQLDGVGNRGLERLLEDVLDPNRNVDHAFRAQYVTLKNDEVLCGLPRREEGQVLVLADLTGVERAIPKKEIKERRDSDTSLMPDNFGEILSPQDVEDLMAFLLRSTGRK